MIYRVIIKVGEYYEAWFDFDNAEESVAFAGQAVKHQVTNEDTRRKKSGITIRVIDTSVVDKTIV